MQIVQLPLGVFARDREVARKLTGFARLENAQEILGSGGAHRGPSSEWP